MSRVQDIALGGGLFVLLAALVACAVQMVLEVLAVERDRRKDARGGQSAGARHAAVHAADAPPPGVVLPAARQVGSTVRVGPVGSYLPDDVFAETVKRAHPDLTEWAS